LCAGEDTSTPLLEKAGRLIEDGETVYRMDMGTPDIDCSPEVKEEAVNAMMHGETKYTDATGIPRLRRAVADKILRDQGLEISPDKNIIVTVGASEALFSLMGAFLDPGDELLVPSPWYCAYYYVPTYYGISVKEVPVVKNCVLNVNISAFEAAITDRTKAILLNYPHNPTGMTYTEEQLTAFAELAKKYDLLVISDECYEKYLFEGTFKSIATLPGMLERTIIINSVSKAYGMTGWRVGYMVMPEAFHRALTDVHGNLILCAPSFCQYGAAKALETETPEQMESLREMYQERCALVTQTLDELGIPYVDPKGAFYIFADIGKTGMDGLVFADRLLEEERVTCMPGEIFGSNYRTYVRFAYTSSIEDIAEAMKRLRNFMEAH